MIFCGYKTKFRYQTPVKQGDWASQVLKDLKELEIQYELEQIQQMSYNK